jgi:hypothetical protein
MLGMLRISLAIVAVLTCTLSYGQQEVLFRSYDCREPAGYALPTVFERVTFTTRDSSLLAHADEEIPVEIDTTDGWKRWSAVENYSFGKDRGGLSMINDLDALHPFFRDRVSALIKLCKKKGIQLAIVETYRTHAKQHEYQTMGRRYTSSGAGKSKHQYGLAVDVVPIVDSVAVWDNGVLWRKIGLTGERLGLRWGGRWRKPYDPGHFEWTGGLTTSHLHSGKLPDIPKSKEYYPCLSEDITLLRKYWSEWETSQSSLTRK